MWPHFQGYGFNLHAERGKIGDFIGKVDDNSPAQAAGLREGDRIIEVNDVSVQNEEHKEVVTKIKSDPNHVRLLVIDVEGERYYKDRGITIHGGMDNVDTFRVEDKTTHVEAAAPVVVHEGRTFIVV